MKSEKIALSNEAKQLKAAIALIKEIGFAEFVRIARTVKQIQRRLTSAFESFTAHYDDIQTLIDSDEDKMPKSVAEAFQFSPL